MDGPYFYLSSELQSKKSWPFGKHIHKLLRCVLILEFKTKIYSVYGIQIVIENLHLVFSVRNTDRSQAAGCSFWPWLFTRPRRRSSENTLAAVAQTGTCPGDHASKAAWLLSYLRHRVAAGAYLSIWIRVRKLP